MKPTQEQVIAWAREVGAATVYDAEVGLFGNKKVEALAALAYEAGRKDENEACAKVCEELPGFDMDDPGSTAAKAIRARGEQ